MSDREERLGLLDELLADASASEVLRQRCVVALRRRRQRRAIVRLLGGLAVAVALLSIATLISRHQREAKQDRPPGRAPEAHALPHPAHLVQTHSLRPGLSVRTGETADPVAQVSTRPASAARVSTSRGTALVIHTSGSAPRVDDEALLASFSKEPAALVTLAAGVKTLLLFNASAGTFETAQSRDWSK